MSRKLRKEEFLAPRVGGWSSLSGSLADAALTMLRNALADRHGGTARLADNHFSTSALGALVLIVTALDVWITENFDRLETLGVQGARVAATEGGDAIRIRFVKLATMAGLSVPDDVLADVGLMAEVRNEIVHHLPRPVPQAPGVPPTLAPLAERRLFASALYTWKLPGSEPSTVDYAFASKLESYALAYWAFRTAESAVEALADGVRASWQGYFPGLRNNFARYRDVCAPEALGDYDRKHGLALTRHGVE